MPGLQVHAFVDRMIFDRSFWKLHRLMDKPVLVFGRKHRQFFHDAFTAVEIAKRTYPEDKQAEQAALIHINIDSMCSADPKLKKQLEIMARKFYKNWWISRKNKKSEKKEKIDPILADLKRTFKKAIELKRLGTYFFG